MAEQSVVARGPGRWRGGSATWALILLAMACLPVAYLAETLLVRVAGLAVAASITATALLLTIGRARAAQAGERALRAANLAVRNDPAPVFCTDSNGAILFQNPAAEDRFGPRQGQPMSRALSVLVPNASAVAFRQESGLLRGRGASETVVTRRGVVRITSYRVGTGALWRIDETGEATQRPQGASSLPMMVVSRSDTILSMNDAMRAMLGERRRALSEVFETLPPQSGQRLRLRGAEDWIEVLVIELQAGDGRREIYTLPVDLLPLEDSVAARAFEALPVALVHIGGDGRLLAANPRAQTLLNLRPGGEMDLAGVVEGLGRPVHDWLTDVLQERIPARHEVVRAKLREDDCFVQITLGRIAGEGGPTLLGVLHDATALKSMEQQFAQSQKMQAIGELAGGVAHDFNNLLTAISGHCDLLMMRHDEGDPDFADLVQINQNANRAASLVGQLLAFSRKQTMRPEVLDLRDTMSDLAHLLNRLVGERVRLEVEHDPGLLPIRADRRQLDQVLMNLVVNARDAMPEGGTVRVATSVTWLSDPLCRDQAEVPPGRYVTIRVEDTGSGIPTDQLSRIFEPFFTTKRAGEGTGLGLSMVYGIVKQSGGYVFADSEPGTGSVFTLYFPVHDQVQPDRADTKTAETAAPDPGPSRDAVVLLVEDEASVRAFASRALQMRGFTVLEAENAEDALQTLSDPELDVDVFVTDIVMPGMDGPTWVREALKTRPQVKVVFVSGYAEDAFDGLGDEMTDSVFLAKPFTLSDLTATVQRQLH